MCSICSRRVEPNYGHDAVVALECLRVQSVCKFVTLTVTQNFVVVRGNHRGHDNKRHTYLRCN